MKLILGSDHGLASGAVVVGFATHEWGFVVTHVYVL